jgi:hypothetical protein
MWAQTVEQSIGLQARVCSCTCDLTVVTECAFLESMLIGFNNNNNTYLKVSTQLNISFRNYLET